LDRLSQGERTVFLAGLFLLLDLFEFPWHKGLPLAILYGDITRTAIQSPNSLQGTLAFLVAVAMVAQVGMTKFTSQRVNPALAKLQPVGGMAVLALLAWKLAIETSYLSIGCYLGMILAVVLAYGGVTMGREAGTFRR
jgi:hypothetical protein